jgi:hypothetical protein
MGLVEAGAGGKPALAEDSSFNLMMGAALDDGQPAGGSL